MTIGQFDGFDLAVGKALGLRRWKLTTDGYLESPIQTYYWEGGENRAGCDSVMSSAFPAYLREEFHQFKRCSCGFYALSSKERLNDYPGPIIGVLEGWGKVVIGEKGWRSEKGAVKAIVLPPAKTVPRLRGFLLDGWNKFVIPLAVLYALLCSTMAHYLYSAHDYIGWGAMMICACLGWLLIRSRWGQFGAAWKGRQRDAQMHDMIRAHYPGIEILPSVGALLAAYGGQLTRPVLDEAPAAERLSA